MLKYSILSLVAVLSVMPNAQANWPCNSDGISRNPDRSVTIRNPHLLRGDEILPISNIQGVCQLFGYDDLLSETGHLRDASVKTASLNQDGSYNSMVSNDTSYVEEVSCFKRSEYLQAKSVEFIGVNPDQSVTLRYPRLLRGNEALLISNIQGVCQLFGFDHMLSDSGHLKDASLKTASLDANGAYSSIVPNDTSYVEEITCYRSGSLMTVGQAGQVIYYHGSLRPADEAALLNNYNIQMKNMN